MPDIFDEIAPDQSASGDIFDEIAPDGGLSPETLAQLNQDIRLFEGGRQMGAGNDRLLTAIGESLVRTPPTPQELREADLAKRAGVEPIPLGTRIAAGLDTGIRQGMATPARLVHGAADLALGAVGAGNTAPARWNADMLKQYAQWEAQMAARDRATFGDNDIANQLASGTGRALTELPLYIAPGMGAATPAAAVARSSAAGGVVGGGTQYALDRGEGRNRLDAATYATASGLITALTTRAFGATGAESVFRTEGIQGIRNRLVAVLKDAGLEGAEEAIDQAQQDILERFSRNPEKPIDATIKEVLMAGAIGGIVGGGVSGAAQGVQAGAGLAQDLLTARDPEQDMLGSPLDTLAGDGTAEANQNQQVLDAAAADFNQRNEVKGDIFDDVAAESPKSQTPESPQNSDSSLVTGKQNPPAAVQATSPVPAASASQVRAELEALPGADQDLRRTVPALTSDQTDAGLREDNAPATKADLIALAQFIEKGGPNPFAAKPDADVKPELRNSGTEERQPADVTSATGKPQQNQAFSTEEMQASTQTLTPSAQGATKDAAASATSTVRSANPTVGNERQRGRVPGNPGMTAEQGSNPRLDADSIPGQSNSATVPTTPKKSRFRFTDRPYDIIDGAEEHLGGKISWKLIKEANPQWKPTGAARKIFAATGQPADTAAQELSDRGIYKGDPGQVDQFAEAVNAAASARIGARKQAKTEKGVMAEEIALNQKFHKDIKQATKRTEPIVANDLNEGDEFTLKGAKLRVKAFGFDGDGNVTSVTLDDGKQYGTQVVDGETTLRMDKGSLNRAATAPDAKPDAVLDALDKLKVDTRGTVQAFGLLPEAWNTLIDLVKLGVRAGRSLRDAIGWAASKFKERNPGIAFDEQGATDYLLTSESREAGQLREQFADERDKTRLPDARADVEAEQVLSRKTPAKPQPTQSPQPSQSEQSEFAKLQSDISAAEAELMDAIRQHMNPPAGTRKAEALQAKNTAAAKLNRLLVQQLKLMTSANVDAARSPEQTAEMISQTVDLLNQLGDEITELNARSQAVPEDLTKLRQDLQTRLNMLKGWTDDQTDKAAQGRAERDKPETLESRIRYMEIEGATNPSKLSFPYWYDRFKLGLKKFTSPIPELPMFGDRARFTALFKRGYRLFAVENNRVKKEAAEKVQAVLEPLAKLGRKPTDNDALQRYYRLSEKLANARAAGDTTRMQTLAEQLHELEQTTLNKDPFNLFRRMVLYRDFYWRGTYLKNENGKPITLPGGLTADEVLLQLRKLTKAISEHPDGLAITEALRRHYALMEELRKSIIDHGEIIPESLNNPTYFPHLLSEYYSDNLGRVNPTTEESFRKYLMTPVGSDKLIQTDYIKAVLQHTAEVLSHNARADLVAKYWATYDVSEQLREQHGDKWDHAYNLPPGYALYAPYKKLPLRATYILPRDVLANQLGVLVNDGDLRTKMAGKVVKVTPEDLRTAMVAGEKIKWALPKEIVDALHGIEKREAALMNQPGHIGAAAGKAVRAGQNIWKKLKLFGPTSFARYTFGNLTTDAIDKVLAADPRIATQMRRAARELWNADAGDLSAEYKAAAREGVFETVTAAEVGELEKIPEFKEFLTTGQIRKVAADKVLGAPAALNSFRESVFRYAKFLADVERLRAGEELPFTGMYHKDIDALGAMPNGQKPVLEGDELIYARAGENSLKHFGDYAMLAVNTQWLRRYLMPFVSWTDVNLRYHATLAANMIDAFKPGASDTQRVHALRISGAKIALTLGLIGLGKELWNQVGGPLLGLWDDDDDLENKLSPADRRRGHIILGKDDKGEVMVIYTPSAWGDVAEWVGGQNFKRLFLEYARGEITLDQWLVDYTKQVFPDFANKLLQSAGPAIKGPYELMSGKSVFPDFFEQRTIAKSEKWWRFVGTMTDDRIAGWVRGVFDEDYYTQPMADQLQQIVLQVRRRDPQQWAFFEVKDKVADWEFEKTGKRFSAGDYTAPEALALRNFRKAIYRGDVVAAERFYNSLLRYGYTAERLDASIRNQAPLAGLNEEQREQFLSELSERERKQLELAEAYYARFSALDGREKDLFPKEGDEPAPDPQLLRDIIEGR